MVVVVVRVEVIEEVEVEAVLGVGDAMDEQDGPPPLLIILVP